MNSNIAKQEEFWDKEIDAFDAIYSQKKSKLSILLDSIFRWDMYARFEYTMKNSQPIKDRTFLDVGCGTGRYSLEFSRKGAKQVVGLDISGNMIERCQQVAEKEKLQVSCHFIQTDLIEYQSDTKFNVCIGIGLFDYIKKPLPILKKLRECTKDKVIISFPRFGTWRALVRKIRLTLKRGDVYFYRIKNIESLLNESGFKSFKIQKIGQLYCVSAFV